VLLCDESLDAMVEPHAATAKPADLYQRAAAAEAVLWRARLVRELEKAGAPVLLILPRKSTPALLNRYLRVRAQRLLQSAPCRGRLAQPHAVAKQPSR
jgi:uncharacterized protein (DUF58 family)